MDETQPTTATATSYPRFPFVGVMITAVSFWAFIFGGLALSAYNDYRTKDNPAAQVRAYLKYLDECLEGIDRVIANGLPKETTVWDKVEALKWYPDPYSDNRKQTPEERERANRAVRMMGATGIWEDLIEKHLDDPRAIRAEVVRVKLIAIAMVGENAVHFSTETWRSFENANLPNSKIEIRDVDYYLKRNDSAMVRIPILIGIGIIGVSFVFWLGAVILTALSPGGVAVSLGRALLPWTYPHPGWKRVAFVFAPVLAGVVYAVSHRHDAVGFSIIALVAGAPLLLIGREIVVWVRKGFEPSASEKTPPQ